MKLTFLLTFLLTLTLMLMFFQTKANASPVAGPKANQTIWYPAEPYYVVCVDELGQQYIGTYCVPAAQGVCNAVFCSPTEPEVPN